MRTTRDWEKECCNVSKVEKIFWQKQKRRKLFPNGTNMTARLRITQFLSRILRFSPYHPCGYVRKSEDKQKNLSKFTTVCDAGTMINDIVRVSRKWKSFDAKEYYGEIVFGCCRCLGPSRLVLDGSRDMRESESAVLLQSEESKSANLMRDHLTRETGSKCFYFSLRSLSDLRY